MDTAHLWAQGIGVVKPMEGPRPVVERRARPQKDQALNCPRCNSTNTKFCYYNNYSLSQPRYFCKTCRRYWTAGGSLRNVPVGGGSRKNKRPSSSSSSPSSTLAPSDNTSTPPMICHPSFSLSASQNPKINEAQDLNLSYSQSDHHQDHNYNNTISKFIELPLPYNNTNHSSNPASSSSDAPSHHHHHHLSSTGYTSKGYNSFMPMPDHHHDHHHHHVLDSSSNNMYPSSGFNMMQDYKPSLGFSLDGFENGYGNLQGAPQQNGARVFFPFEDLKQGTTDQQNRSSGQGDSTGFWNGVLGGGSW